MDTWTSHATVLGNQHLEVVSYALAQVQVNPFRQPWRIRPRDNALPSFSNGFLVGIN
jgi:hypothetical protein